MTSAPQLLIVNADDFGLSPGVNRGIITAHEHGIVTSASLMIHGSASQEAGEYARTHSTISVGLHIDLAEWTFKDGEWVQLYAHADANDRAAVEFEIAHQLDAFRRLVGRHPTHLDSHQHVHRQEPAKSVVLAIGERLGAPVRHFTAGIRYCGNFYGQDDQGNTYPDLISAENLIALLERLEPGITELGCHPGEADLKHTMYANERRLEVTSLCDARVRAAIESLGIQLVTFRHINRAESYR